MTLLKLLSQQKPGIALFCILTTSICIKTHFSWLDSSGKAKNALENEIQWFLSTLHKLLSQQKSGNALFCILTTSLCVKRTFLDSGCSEKAKIAFENCNLVFFIMIAMSQCHDLSWSCMIMQENGSCDNAISFLKLKMLRITHLGPVIIW